MTDLAVSDKNLDKIINGVFEDDERKRKSFDIEILKKLTVREILERIRDTKTSQDARTFCLFIWICASVKGDDRIEEMNNVLNGWNDEDRAEYKKIEGILLKTKKQLADKIN